MSKQDNLTDFLTDVADAIREKKGTTEKINPQNFSEEIRGIESGGGDGWNGKFEIIDPTKFGRSNVRRIVIDDGVVELTQGACYGFSSLIEISIPDSVVSFGIQTFYTCYALENINIPNHISSLPSQCFLNCNNLRLDSLPDALTTIGDSCFQNVRGTTVFTFPSGVVKIGANAFNGGRAGRYDFRRVSAVPTLDNINAFNGILTNFKIVVPDNLYDQWIAATNWITYASKIVKASEFVEPTNNE